MAFLAENYSQMWSLTPICRKGKNIEKCKILLKRKNQAPIFTYALPYLQWLAKKLVIWAFYLIKWLFSIKDFDLWTSCYAHTRLAPNKGGFEISKKVLYVFVAQWATKLQLWKIFHKLGRCTTLQPFELQRRTAPFWKPPKPPLFGANQIGM